MALYLIEINLIDGIDSKAYFPKGSLTYEFNKGKSIVFM